MRFLLLAGRDILASPTLQRTNYRDRPLPTAAGLFAVLAVLTVEAGRSTLGAFGIGDEPGGNPARALVLFACLGFGLLGFVDDVLDRRRQRLKAPARWRPVGSRPVCAIISGVAVAFVLASRDIHHRERLLSAAVLIALALRTRQLLDRVATESSRSGLAACGFDRDLAGTARSAWRSHRCGGVRRLLDDLASGS